MHNDGNSRILSLAFHLQFQLKRNGLNRSIFYELVLRSHLTPIFSVTLALQIRCLSPIVAAVMIAV